MAEEDEADQGMHFRGGPQEHEPVMGFCTDHCTGENYMEDLVPDVRKCGGGPESESEWLARKFIKCAVIHRTQLQKPQAYALCE